MSDTPTAFCPECHPGDILDPRTEILESCTAHYRRPELPGSADALVRLSPWDHGATVETAEQTRAACDAIHRGAPTR